MSKVKTEAIETCIKFLSFNSNDLVSEANKELEVLKEMASKITSPNKPHTAICNNHEKHCDFRDLEDGKITCVDESWDCLYKQQ